MNQWLNQYATPPILMAEAQHIGYNQHNATMEDRCIARQLTTPSGMDLYVGVVADGIGGFNAGEVASQTTVDTILKVLQSSPETNPIKLVEQALQAAHQVIRKNSRANPIWSGMGTTAILAVIHEKVLYLGHVGDSRAYLLRKGKLSQLTMDHTWGNENVRKKLLTPEEAKRLGRRGELARYIGQANTPVLEVDVGYRKNGNVDPANSILVREGLPLEAGDVILLCTDGLVKERLNGNGTYVEEAELIITLARNQPKDAVNRLLQYALGRKVDDNVSVVVMQVPGKKQVPISILLPKKGWLLGGVALVAVLLGIMIAILLPPPSSPPVTESLSPTSMVAPGEASFVQVVRSDAASIQEGETASRLLQSGEDFGLAEQTILSTEINGYIELRFDDGSQVWIAENSRVNLRQDAQNGIVIEIESGNLLIRSEKLRVFRAGGDYWAETSEGATMGISYIPNLGEFIIDCVGGKGTCTFYSSEPQIIYAGQRTGVKQNLLIPTTDADYESWSKLAPQAVITPTATPTSTATATLQPTSTPLPTATKSPSTVERDTGGSGGGSRDNTGGSGGGSGDNTGGGNE